MNIVNFKDSVYNGATNNQLHNAIRYITCRIVKYNDRAIILHKITHSGISRGNPFWTKSSNFGDLKILVSKFYFQAAATRNK